MYKCGVRGSDRLKTEVVDVFGVEMVDVGCVCATDINGARKKRPCVYVRRSGRNAATRGLRQKRHPSRRISVKRSAHAHGPWWKHQPVLIVTRWIDGRQAAGTTGSLRARVVFSRLPPRGIAAVFIVLLTRSLSLHILTGLRIKGVQTG